MGTITKGLIGHVRPKFAIAGLLCAAWILADASAYPAETKQSPPQTCQPGMGEVAVRTAKGRCSVKGPGIYSTTSAMGLENEPIDRILLGMFTEAVVCGLDSLAHLECERVFPFSGKEFRDVLHGSTGGTFLHVAGTISDLECRPKAAEVTISGRGGIIRDIGPCIRLGPGRYRTPEELGLGDTGGLFSKQVELTKKGKLLLLQSKMLSVRTGREVQAKMCSRDNFREDCLDLNQDQSADFDWAPPRSMKVWSVRCRSPWVGQVTLFEEPNASGPCTLREVGDYLTADSLTIHGGAIRSIKVGPQVEVRMCSEENMQGECIDIKESTDSTGTIRSLSVRSR